MSGWGDWQSPDEQAAQQRAAEEAHRLAGMTDFEKQALGLVGALVDGVGALVATVGSRQPADPICNQCGTVQPIAGQIYMTFDQRRERAASELAAKHPEHPYPFWVRVVADVLAAMNWTVPAAGDSSDGRGAPEPTADEGHHSAPGDTGQSSSPAAGTQTSTAAGIGGGSSAGPVTPHPARRTPDTH